VPPKLAFFAWALAENQGGDAEVEGALKEAFALCDRDTKPVLAELYFCAGHAYALLGNAAESSRHFKFAAEMDPAGNYGRLSQAARQLPNRPPESRRLFCHRWPG
jgi:hypothetical protein